MRNEGEHSMNGGGGQETDEMEEQQQGPHAVDDHTGVNPGQLDEDAENQVQQQQQQEGQHVHHGEEVHLQHQHMQQNGQQQQIDGQQEHETMMEGGNVHGIDANGNHVPQDDLMTTEQMIGNNMGKASGRKKRLPRIDRGRIGQLLQHRGFTGKMYVTLLEELDKSSVSGHTQHDFMRYFDSHDFHALRDNCNRTCLRLICRSRGIKSASNIKEILAAKLSHNTPTEILQQHDKAIRGGHSPRKPKRKMHDGYSGLEQMMGDDSGGMGSSLHGKDGMGEVGDESFDGGENAASGGPNGVPGTSQNGMEDQMGEGGMQDGGLMDHTGGRKDKVGRGRGTKRKTPRISAKEELHSTLRHLSQVQKSILNRLGSQEANKNAKILEVINLKMKGISESIMHYENRASKLREIMREADVDPRGAEEARAKLPIFTEQIAQLEEQYGKLMETLKDVNVANMEDDAPGDDGMEMRIGGEMHHPHQGNQQEGPGDHGESESTVSGTHETHGNHEEEHNAGPVMPTQQI